MNALIDMAVDFVIKMIMGVFQALKNGRLLCFPTGSIIGSTESRNIEKYHPLSYIQENIWQDSSNTLYIGSPYLTYWFETSGEPRMLNLLDNTIKLKVSVIYFTSDIVLKNSLIITGLKTCKKKYPNRFRYSIINRYSSISYIEYRFMRKKQLYYRCLVGFQDSKYSERPFIEFVGKDEDKSSFVKAILESHKELQKSNE